MSQAAPAVSPSPASDRELVISRLFDAPRELVFQAWTDARHLGTWFGPKGFTTTTRSIDLRVGGAWQFVMHAPNGTDFENRITWLEVTPPERIVYDHGVSEADPAQFRVTVTFAEEGGKTRLTMRSVFPNAEAVAARKKFGAEELGMQTLEKLAEVVARLR